MYYKKMTFKGTLFITGSVRIICAISLISVILMPAYSMATDPDVTANISTAQNYTKNTDKRVKAIQSLGESGEERALLPLLTILKDVNEEQGIRSCAARALTNLGKPRLEIIHALEDVFREKTTGKNLGYTILLLIGKMQSLESIKLVSDALVNADSMTRFKAAQALGHMQREEALRLLTLHYNREKDRIVRAEVARALGHYENATAEEMLSDIVRNDPEPLVRMNAALMLGKYKKLSTKARKALEAALEDTSSSVQKTAKGILR
jgi:HEAT repeat protein